MTLIPLLPDSLFPLLAVFSISLAECACVPRRCVHHVSVSAPRACMPQRCVRRARRCTQVHAGARQVRVCRCATCVTCMPQHRVCVCLSAVCTSCACLPWRCVRRVRHMRASAPCASRACMPRCRVRHVRASAPHVRYICRCLGATCVTCVRSLVLRACVSASAPGMSRACIPRG